MQIIEASIRRPVMVTVAVLLIAIFGSLLVQRVPVQLTPNVDQPMVTITTNWIGASPQEVVREIVEEQEEVLKTIEGLREMTSTSNWGSSTVKLEFHIGVDKDKALNEVRDKLRQVPEYPNDVDEPVVQSVTSASQDYIAWMLLTPPPGEAPKPGSFFEGDVTELQDFAEDFIKPELERAEGVSEVMVFGGREREMQVRIDLQKLAARGMTVEQCIAALQKENADLTAGAIEAGKLETSVRVVGQYADPESILNTVVAYSQQGTPVYVRDIATARIGFKRQTSMVRSQGVPVMAIAAKRETGSNVLEVMSHLKQAIVKVNEQVLQPRGWNLELRQVYDQTIYINDAVSAARSDLIMGSLLAAVVLFLTLRSVGATLVVLVAIPISIVGTFVGMALTGRSLNVISMAGLTFAVGMGIDNCIVVLENIFRHREMGKDRFQAAFDGTKEVWGAIVAATLTNIAVFLPIVFIQDEAGQLFRDLAIALTFSFILYLLVSPTVIPMLASLFLRKMPSSMVQKDTSSVPQTRLGRITQPIARLSTRMSEGFYHLVLWFTRGIIRRVAMFVVMVVGAYFASIWLMPPSDYLPAGNQNLLFGILAPPPGYNLNEFRSMAEDHIEKQLRPWWEAAPGTPEMAELQEQWLKNRDEVAIPGMLQQVEETRNAMKDAPPEAVAAAIAPIEAQIHQLQRTEPPSGIDNFFYVTVNSTIFMGATAADRQNPTPLLNLFNKAVSGIPGTFGQFFQFPIFQSEETGNSLSISLRGDENDRVLKAAEAMQGTMGGIFKVYVRAEPANFNLGRPEVRVDPDRVRSAAAGTDTAAIRTLSAVAVEGAVLGDYRDLGRSIDLTLMSDRRYSVPQLADVPMATRDGRVIPMGSVVNLVQISSPQQINRIEEQPAVTLTLPLAAGQTIQEASETLRTSVIEPLREAGVLTPDITVRATGNADRLEEFLGSFIPGFVLAGVVCYLLMAALMENFIYPLVIIMSVPVAMVGGFLGLAILHHFVPTATLDVLTMLGFVILIGTIVNNPILIVYQTLNYTREGMERNKAIALSTQTRVRPIFMSVITSVAAMVPLVVMGGAGSELYRGLGAVVVGGLLLSTIFTLIITPTLMSLMMDLSEGIMGLRRKFSRAG